MTLLTSADLQAYLDRHRIEGEIIHLDVPTPTVEAAARALGVTSQQIVKSVLFLIRGEPVLAVACGTSHIDRRRIARHFGVGRKRVKLGDGTAVKRHTGYAPGAVPPFGHPIPLKTMLDPGVLAHDRVFGGGGAENAMLGLPPEEIRRVARPVVMELLEDD